MRELLDVYPCKDRALFLKKEMDISLLITLKYLVDVVLEKFPTSYTKQQSLVVKLLKNVESNSLSLSADFYILNKSLQNEIKLGNLSEVEKLLNHLLLIPTSLRKNIKYSELKKNSSSIINSSFVNIFTYEFKEALDIDFEYQNCEDFFYSKKAIKNALEYLCIVDKELYNELNIYLSNILILNSHQINAGSSFYTFGLVYLKELDKNQHWIIFLEHLVHECAHLHLYAIWKKDPIVLNERKEKYKSPLRKDLRPMSGIYHAMFVLSRLIYLEQKIYSHDTLKQVTPYWTTFNNNARNNASLKDKFNDAYSTVLEFGKLTEVGREILYNCKRMVDKITFTNSGY